jgi:hypothetical protein
VRERDDLRRDADGFLDMDQFETADLDPAACAALREWLIGADVPTPGAERFDEWAEQALEADPETPDIADLVPSGLGKDSPGAAPDSPWEDLEADASGVTDGPEGVEYQPDDPDPDTGLT